MAVNSFKARHPKTRSSIVSLRTVYQLVWNHPFILIIILALICLHQYFPFVFCLLVSVSPVLFCTAVLLGALLVHGQPNDHRSADYHRGVSSKFTSQNSANRDGIFSKDRFFNVKNEIIERSMEVSGMLGAGIRGIDRVVNQVEWDSCNSEFNHGKSKSGFLVAEFEDIDIEFHVSEDQSQNMVKENDKILHVEVDAGFKDCVTSTPLETLPLLDSEDVIPRYLSHDASPKSDEMQTVDLNLSNGDSDGETVYVDEEREDETDDDDGDSEEDDTLKGKDGGEKSAVTWTEDDQKTLLELTSSEMEKREQLESLIARMSRGRSEEKVEEDEEGISEHVGEEDEEEEDEDEEENNHHVDQDGSKLVTLWTEEDEKNLKALGTSELERDQRLESLLARRRVRRNFSMISERNLIDLDFSGLPFQVAPISTIRVNPFDNTDDTKIHQNVPPIPGSAPSITLPRKNPFDSPTASPRMAENPMEESSMEDSMEMDINASSSSQQNPIEGALKPDSMEINRKEASLRRYESFSSGYNVMTEASELDFMEVDRRDAVFSRHESFGSRPGFSEKSHRRRWRPVFILEQVATEEEWHPSRERELSDDDSLSTASSHSDSEASSTVLEFHEDETPGQEEQFTSVIDQDREETTTLNQVSTHSEIEIESESAYSEALENGEDYINQKTLVASEETYDTASSTPISCEHDENCQSEGKYEEFEVEESVFSPKVSLDESDIKYMSTEEDHEDVEPVYDESPSASEKNRAFSPSSDQM